MAVVCVCVISFIYIYIYIYMCIYVCMVSIVTEWFCRNGFYKESSDVRYLFLVSLSLMFVVCVPVVLRSLWTLVDGLSCFSWAASVVVRLHKPWLRARFTGAGSLSVSPESAAMKLKANLSVWSQLLFISC